MHINQLEHFAATMEGGSFLAAAKKVYLTPQAIEKSIHNLEQELGGTLFEPAGRAYQPTQLGKTLYGPALDAIDRIERIRDIARAQTLPSADESELTLAVSVAPYRCAWFTPASLDRLRTSSPDTHLSIRYDSTETCLSAVRSGMADAAVTIGPMTDPGLQSRRLFSFPIKVALSPNHPLTGLHPDLLSPHMLARYPIASPLDTGACRRAIEKSFSDAGALPRFCDVRIGQEKGFLDKDGLILVADKTFIAPVAPEARVVDLVDRDRIVLPICFVKRPGKSNPSLELLASHLARIGGEVKEQLSRQTASAPNEIDSPPAYIAFRNEPGTPEHQAAKTTRR